MAESKPIKSANLAAKLRGWINNALDGTHDHYACFLPEHSGSFSSAILRLFFTGITVDKNQIDIVKNIPDDAIIVYTTKYKSNFDYLFYYTRYRLSGLPFPDIGFDYNIFIWQKISRLFKILLAHLDFFMQNFSSPNPYKRGYFKKKLLAGHAGFLSLVEKGGFYRRFVKAKTDPIEYLIEMQKTVDRPIFLVPQLMFFSKKPNRSHPGLIDILFGTEDRPGKTRRMLALFKYPGKVFVETADPLNLQQFLELEDIREQSTERQTGALRHKLLVQINRHRQSITGPVLKSREELKESILTHERFQEFMDKYSKSRNIQIPEIRKRADAYLEEIAAKYNIGMLRIFSALVGWIIHVMFDGVTINHDGLNRVKAMYQKGPLILIPCHKSHIDYLILSYLLYHNNMPCPHIAAGKNLSFWPLGPLFRSGGAFFIRRTFGGAVLYSKVFTEYLYKLLEEGFNIEFFIEGGRSRTGKLILPKLGLLSILLDAYKNKVCNDLIFAPIYIGYDRILEESAYLHELEGGQKEPESFWQIIKARKFLKKRYGKIYIQFHDPISLNALFSQNGTSIEDMSAKDKNAFCRNLGHRVINSINKSTVVTPHGVVASALLNFNKNRFSYSKLRSQVDTYIKYLNSQDALLADTLVIDQDHAIWNAFNAYVQRKFIEPVSKNKDNTNGDAEYFINTGKRPALEYYKNNCISFFIPAAFTALEILNKDAFQFSVSDLRNGYALLQELFKNEFAYDIELAPEHYVLNIIRAFTDDAIIMPHKTLPDTYNLTSAGFRKIKQYSSFLRTYFESYLIVLNFFKQNPNTSKNIKDRMKKIEAMGNRMYKRNEIERQEALSKVTYENAADFFISRGVKGPDDMDKIELYDKTIKRYLSILQQ
jgi:glycerol-3-phosphate O-acyltransferase